MFQADQRPSEILFYGFIFSYIEKELSKETFSFLGWSWSSFLQCGTALAGVFQWGETKESKQGAARLLPSDCYPLLVWVPFPIRSLFWLRWITITLLHMGAQGASLSACVYCGPDADGPVDQQSQRGPEALSLTSMCLCSRLLLWPGGAQWRGGWAHLLWGWGCYPEGTEAVSECQDHPGQSPQRCECLKPRECVCMCMHHCSLHSPYPSLWTQARYGSLKIKGKKRPALSSVNYGIWKTTADTLSTFMSRRSSAA